MKWNLFQKSTMKESLTVSGIFVLYLVNNYDIMGLFKYYYVTGNRITIWMLNPISILE